MPNDQDTTPGTEDYERQLTVGALKKALENIPDEHPVYFRRVAPVCGNIEGAYRAELSEYAFFGGLYPCVILEPAKD